MIKFQDVTIADKDTIQSFTLHGELQNCDLSSYITHNGQ